VDFDAAASDIANVGKTFLVYMAPDELNGGILFTDDNEMRFGLIIIPDYAFGTEDMITQTYAEGIISLKEYLNNGGRVIASGKSGYLLEKWGIITAGTYDTSKLISSIDSD